MQDAALQLWVPILVALASGAALPKLIEVWGESLKRRRTRMTVEQQLRRQEKRTRLAVEWGHKNAVLAIRAGVPEEKLPVLDLGEDNKGET